MAIEKYVTSCFVIESFEQGENDRVYKLFTREFGLVFAHAKSIRKLESKLRSHVLPNSISTVTLVKGREVWRLVGGEEVAMDNKLYIHEATKLIGRFVKGEGSHKGLYDRLIKFIKPKFKYDPNKYKVLLFYIFLVELGYADARVIGARTLREYLDFSIDDLYNRLILSYDDVIKHIRDVTKELQI